MPLPLTVEPGTEAAWWLLAAVVAVGLVGVALEVAFGDRR